MLLHLLALPAWAVTSAPASQPVNQLASRPAASRPAASQPAPRVYKQGQDVKSAGWTINVLSSSCKMAKRIGDPSGKERMYVTMEVRFTNTSGKHAYTPPIMVEDANHNRFAAGAYLGAFVSAGNHLTKELHFDIPSRRQLRLTWTDPNDQTWWIALTPKLQVER